MEQVQFNTAIGRMLDWCQDQGASDLVLAEKVGAWGQTPIRAGADGRFVVRVELPVTTGDGDNGS